MKQSTDPLWRRFESAAADFVSRLRNRGLDVKSPDRIRDLVTNRWREVDATIRETLADGKVRLTVIECRRRRGRQDDPWIEQLASKKKKIGAHRLIAVSSTGFSQSAQLSAAHFGIELRTLAEFSEESLQETFGGLEQFVDVVDYAIKSLMFFDQHGNPIDQTDFSAELSQQLSNNTLYAAVFLDAAGEPAGALEHVVRRIGADEIPRNGIPVLKRGVMHFRENSVFVRCSLGLRAVGRVDLSVEFVCYEQPLVHSYAVQMTPNAPNAAHMVISEGTMPDGTPVSATFLGTIGSGARAI